MELQMLLFISAVRLQPQSHWYSTATSRRSLNPTGFIVKVWSVPRGGQLLASTLTLKDTYKEDKQSLDFKNNSLLIWEASDPLNPASCWTPGTCSLAVDMNYWWPRSSQKPVDVALGALKLGHRTNTHLISLRNEIQSKKTKPGMILLFWCF